MLNRKVPHARFIEEQISDGRAAIEAGNLLSALALALTFPDVFGQTTYPEMVFDNDRRKAGTQYAKWFDECVGVEYMAPEEPGSRELKSYFTGRMCWKLRCAYLHACDAIGDMTESTRPDLVKRHVRIGIGRLCTCLCDAAELCLHDNAEQFVDSASDLLDLPPFVELYGLDS